jgi:hypothetical protein
MVHPYPRDAPPCSRLGLDAFSRGVSGGRTFAQLETEGGDEENPQDGDDYDCLISLMANLLHVAHQKRWSVQEVLTEARTLSMMPSSRKTNRT